MKKFISCAVSIVLIFFSVVALASCGKNHGESSYSLSLEFVPNESKLYGEMEVAFSNTTQNTIDELKFQLYPNAYREGAVYSPVSELYSSAAYYDGKSYGGIEIASVSEGTYQIGGKDENILCVKLADTLYPDETTALTIKFEVTLPHVNHRLGIGARTVNLANFYPILCAYGENGFKELIYSDLGDPFVSECADYTVSLTVPSEYQIICGLEGDSVTQNGRTVFRGKANNVRDVAFILGKDLKHVTKKANGVEVEYWYVADDSPETALGAAAESLSYFSETFSAYAYPKYVVVQTDFPYGGMEYTALSLVSATLQKREIAPVIAHETAHQWWYAMVGSDQFDCAWQDEGLAEYSASLFLEQYPKYGDGYEAFIRRSESSYRAFFSVRSQMTGDVDTSMNRPLTAYTGEYEYRNLAYDKGVILFDRVRSVLGDKRFFAGLKAYCANYCGKIASGEQLVNCFTETGLNVEGLFASFIEGTCVI